MIGKCFILVKVTVDLEPILETLAEKQEYIHVHLMQDHRMASETLAHSLIHTFIPRSSLEYLIWGVTEGNFHGHKDNT